MRWLGITTLTIKKRPGCGNLIVFEKTVEKVFRKIECGER